MGTPTNRTPVRVARGSTTALNTGLSDIQEGEIVWDTTTNKLKVKEGSALEESNPAADATKAPLASPTFTGTVAIPNVANLETAVVANTAKVTNATHTGDVTGSTALTIAANAVTTAKIADDAVTGAKIADDTITEANLDVSNAPTNGHYLQAQSGEGGGLTWAAVSAGGISNNSSQTNSIGLGTNALDSETTNTESTAVGVDALTANTTGYYNVAIGKGALTANTTGFYNVAIGFEALSTNTDGNYNTASGNYALMRNTTGTSNVAVGNSALNKNTTGDNNTASGNYALRDNTTGINNTASGYYALKENTTGYSNTAVGNQALKDNTNGYGHTAFGDKAFYSVDGGYQSVAVGVEAGYNATSGYRNTFIGPYAGTVCTTGSNLSTLGYNAQPSSATAVNEITLGDANIGWLRCNDTSIASLSDARDKTEIEPSPLGVDFLNTLNPVKFKWKTRDGNIKDGTHEIGFIAQELQAVQKESNTEYLKMVLDENPDRLEASYGQLVPVLVQAIQELSAQVKELQKTS